MPDYCLCRDTLCQMRHSCFRYRAKPNGWRQSYFQDSPAVGGFCEHYMGIDGWPDKLLRPEGEEIVLTEDENALIDAEVAQENMEADPTTMKTAITLANDAEKSKWASEAALERANLLAQVARSMEADAEEAKQVAAIALADAEMAVVGTSKAICMAAAAMARAQVDTDEVDTDEVDVPVSRMSPFMAGLSQEHVPEPQYGSFDAIELLDVAADAAHTAAAKMLGPWQPPSAWRCLLVPCIFVKNVVYSTIWVLAVAVIAPFVFLWSLATRLGK